MNLDLARAAADAVLFEGYLLYPYRASSTKNQARWQFGILGPPGAADAGLGEPPTMAIQCLLDSCSAEPAAPAAVVVHLRFLQLQHRQVYDAAGQPVHELEVGDQNMITWDEAVPHEVTLGWSLAEISSGVSADLTIPGGEELEPLTGVSGDHLGHLTRSRWPLSARVTVTSTPLGRFTRLELGVANCGHPATSPADKTGAIRRSLIAAHLILEAHQTSFVSLLEPPDEAVEAARQCSQLRCWPVLTGAAGDTDLVLGSPIIVYDYPEIAPESPGALFDATEIDEILILRVMTMTEAEKAEARATDPRAREIIDRCEAMTPEALQQLHGALRTPHPSESAVPGSTGQHRGAHHPGRALGRPEPRWPTASESRGREPPSFDTGELPWWDPGVDEAVQPQHDVVTIGGVPVSKDSLVRVRPKRRADAQDVFFADQVARVTAVLSDVDGEVHVAVVLVDDPAADLHEWYGRYLYFGPDELEPLDPGQNRQSYARQQRGG